MEVIFFGVLMGAAHFFSEEILAIFREYKGEIISFSAGISISYLFLSLFPKFVAFQKNEFLFLAILFGFSIFHIIEKYIYKTSSRYKRAKELAIEDSVISFIYHFIIGMIMVNFFNASFSEGVLFFIPAALYTGINTIPVDMTKSKIIKGVLASSTLLGILFAAYIYTRISQIIYLILLGFVIGALTFTVTRHSIPAGKKGRPLFFIIGVVIYSIIILML